MSTITEKAAVARKIEFLMKYVTRKGVPDFWWMNNTLYLTKKRVRDFKFFLVLEMSEKQHSCACRNQV